MKPGRRLGPKLTAILIVYLFVALAAVGLTLLMSWQLEGGAAAVNEMGSQRMRAYHIALALTQSTLPEGDRAALNADIHNQVADFDRVLDDLERGDSSRPMLLPRKADIHARFTALRTQWAQDLKPRI
ncbi:MAG: type IV pili methyl-accepting chemotaxis transducer N-terminal domain-containing protein, partial [Burkholderiales bacterium]|nr:type IV pili methyl-accepting chemotaxis transducer N-terminal domain-containing protein [Burkholderiales bacterium]